MLLLLAEDDTVDGEEIVAIIEEGLKRLDCKIVDRQRRGVALVEVFLADLSVYLTGPLLQFGLEICVVRLIVVGNEITVQALESAHQQMEVRIQGEPLVLSEPAKRLRIRESVGLWVDIS